MRFGYWGIRGQGQFIRVSAAYLGVELQEENPESREAWFEEKESMGFDFPNLPYLIDGDYKLTESRAIPRYIAAKAEKNEFFGSTPEEIGRVEMILGVWDDIRKGLFKGIWGAPSVEQAKTNVREAAMKLQSKIDQMIALTKESWAVGENVTFADVVIFVNYEMFTALFGAMEMENIFSGLAPHGDRFRELPGVKEFVSGDKRPWMMPGMILGLSF